MNTLINFLLLIIPLVFFGCSKPSDTTLTNTNTGTGTLYFHLHTAIDSTEVAYGDTARNIDGAKIILSLAQFYISGIKLQKQDGSWLAVNGVYILKKVENEIYLIGNNIPVGNYLTVSFNIGIDSAANAKSPSSYPDSTNVLSPQNPSMWFGSVSQGYIFINLQGAADTSSNKNGTCNVKFNYKIGSNSLLKNVILPQKSFSVSPGQTFYIHLYCDYGKLLQGVNFKTQTLTDTYTNNPALAAQIATNFAGFIYYE
ncbi:MAG: MbnP family protein [Bacteroidia bacterium]